MGRRKPKSAKAALINHIKQINQFTELVFVIGWMEDKRLLTDIYRITSRVGELISMDAMIPYVTPDKPCLAFRGISNGMGFHGFHPNINEETKSYAYELIKKNYPLKGYKELQVTDDHVIVDLDELDETKPQQDGVN